MPPPSSPPCPCPSRPSLPRRRCMEHCGDDCETQTVSHTVEVISSRFSLKRLFPMLSAFIQIAHSALAARGRRPRRARRGAAHRDGERARRRPLADVGAGGEGDGVHLARAEAGDAEAAGARVARGVCDDDVGVRRERAAPVGPVGSDSVTANTYERTACHAARVRRHPPRDVECEHVRSTTASSTAPAAARRRRRRAGRPGGDGGGGDGEQPQVEMTASTPSRAAPSPPPSRRRPAATPSIARPARGRAPPPSSRRSTMATRARA